MRGSIGVRLGLFAGIAALMAGCGNGGGGASGPLAVVPATLPANALAASRGPLAVPKAQIYVVADQSSFGPATVYGYRAKNEKNRAPFCHVAAGGGVNSLTVDAGGALWIPQGNGSLTGTITSNAPGCGASGTTLTDPDGFPSQIAFSSTGIGYVSNIAAPASGPGSVSVYPKGATQPSGKLTNRAIAFGFGVALDSKDNVYMSYGSNGSSSGGVIEFAGGKMPGKRLKNVVVGTAGLLLFDKHDNLVIIDQSTFTVDIFAPPYTSPPTSFQLQGATQQCVLNKAQTSLACADFSNHEVDIYAYPAGTFSYSFNNGLSPSTVTIGIAYNPA